MRWFHVLAFICASPALAHERISTDVTFDREVVRIVRARCLPCHGALGESMPLHTYAAARPWAKAIRDAVESGSMPPWPPARGVGLIEDRSLSPWEVDVLVAWAEGGAPEGETRDLPAADDALTNAPARPDSARSLRVGGTMVVPSATVLYSVRPQGRVGASLELRVTTPDGAVIPIVWIPSFDPRHAYAYALREPLLIPAGARLHWYGPPRSRVEVTVITAPASAPPRRR